MQHQELINNLKQHEQEHLLNFWADLNETERQKLTGEINKINFKELNEDFIKTKEEHKAFSKLDSLMEPIPSESKGSYQNSTIEQLESYESIGIKYYIIKSN